MDIPEHGFKLLVIAGKIDGNLIWRQVGTLKTTKRGVPIIYLDRSFNPAGTLKEDDSPSVSLHVREFSQEELKRFEDYKGKPSRSSYRRDYKEKDPEDFDDEIPF